MQSNWLGFQVIGEQLRSLPTGSTMDSAQGVFYWQPGPGFHGTYCLVFVENAHSGAMNRKDIIVKIVPKFE